MEWDIAKMTVIGNITQMQDIIGLPRENVNALLKKSYDDLYDKQNSLIDKYNQAIRNNGYKNGL